MEKFNIISYVKRLEAHGLTRDQAEEQIQVMSEMITNSVATKQDIKQEVALLKQEVKLLEVTLRSEIATQVGQARSEILDELRSRLNMGFTAMGLGFAALAALAIFLR